MATSGIAFQAARGVAVGPDGNYYVADLNQGLVLKVDSASGVVSNFATAAKAYGVLWSDNQLYVTSFNAGGAITSFDTDGNQVASVVTGFSNLTDLISGPASGEFFVSSQGAHGVLHVVSGTTTLFADTSAQGAVLNGGSISTPRGLAVVGGNLYVSDSATCSGGNCSGGGNNITVFNASTGVYESTLVGSAGNPQGLVYDAATTSLYYAANLGGGISAADLTGVTSLYSSIAGTHDLVILSGAPEPGTAMLMLGALSGALLRFRKRRK